jgi:hypothetical protein
LDPGPATRLDRWARTSCDLSETAQVDQRFVWKLWRRDPQSAKDLVASTASLCGVSRRLFISWPAPATSPKLLHRSDRGKPKIIPVAELERYCET